MSAAKDQRKLKNHLFSHWVILFRTAGIRAEKCI